MNLEDMIRAIVREELARVRPDIEPDDDLLSTAQAAAFAKVHEKTIRRWVADGRLQAQHAGRLLRFRRADLEAALAGNDNKLTPEQLAARKYG